MEINPGFHVVLDQRHAVLAWRALVPASSLTSRKKARLRSVLIPQFTGGD